MFNKICIIGVGLIGGSIARAAREKGLCSHIVGLGRQQSVENLRTAKKIGVIDEYFVDIELAVKDADFVIICSPVGAIESIFKQLQSFWNELTIYTDAGSTKSSVIDAAKSVFSEVPANFVPAHPIAGAEKSGVEASKSDLFNNKRLLVTPVQTTCDHALAKVIKFWEEIGSKVSIMDAEHHDTVLAATSHLPHILAFSLVNLLGKKDEQVDIFKYAAGGFKDFTRIASSDPTMWLDICLANKNELIPLIQQLQEELKGIEKMLINNESQQLLTTFSYANSARQRFLNQLDNQ